MVTLTVGTVVLVPFPFSDLSTSKLRPAVVLADAGRGDFILCQVTSKSYGDDRDDLNGFLGHVGHVGHLGHLGQPGQLKTM